MSSIHITYSGLGLLAALLLAIFTPFFYRYRKRQRTPYVYYSQVADLPISGRESTHNRWFGLPDKLFMACLILLALGLTDLRMLLPPRAFSGHDKTQILKTPTEGIALYFVLDISGSMASKVLFGNEFISKVDLMKRLTESFIDGRPNDLIGLVTFARMANILAPLTLDRQAILDQLHKVQVVKDESIDGTGIGYAIYKTAGTIVATRHFGEQLPKNQRPAYTINSNVIILVTDGFQSPSELDKGNWMRTIGMEDAARFAADQGIKLYIVDIEPSLALPEFEPHRNLLNRVADITGGKFFLAESYDAIPDIYSKIDALEKSTLPVDQEALVKEGAHRVVPLWTIFVACGLICFAAAVILDTMYLRVVP